ncbi:MAG: transglutaminase [Phyllobacteriaceae bacterium]|nr:transglutaminase [Phyllobacteriaceae bacterium]MBA89427.1 transglutaminase [Phyllobacteriaceae bacterium]
MLYDIRLAIEYAYDAPADGGRHVLRLLPREIRGIQKVLEATVECTPQPVERAERRDFFGNAAVDIRYGEAVTRTGFVMRARVERPAPVTMPAPALALADLAGDLAATRSLGPDSPHHFLPPSPRVPPDGAIAAWALGVTEGAGTVLEAARRVCNALNDEMAFDPDFTAVDMPHADAFAARRGVCQDFTHIMIGALRSLGIPAGYVSGFLRTLPPEGQSRLEGADAMHAWVRVWCGGKAGWAELDPTNRMDAGQDHVVVAHGRDYFDVAPVKGHLRLSGGQTTTQSVDMVSV